MSIVSSKKGFEIFMAWVEVFFVVFLLIGLLLGFIIRDVTLSYVVFFLFGMVTGTLIYNNRMEHFFHYILLSSSFSIGYVIGNSAPKFALMAIFVMGNLFAYFIFEKKLIKLI